MTIHLQACGLGWMSLHNRRRMLRAVCTRRCLRGMGQLTIVYFTDAVTALREMFARYGLPEQVVTDNEPQFTLTEFRQFLTANRVKHILCSPYHPSSNGAAERLVQTVKQALKAGCQKGVLFEQALASFLLQYRTTPHATTGVPPSSLFLQQSLCTRLDLLKPQVAARG